MFRRVDFIDAQRFRSSRDVKALCPADRSGADICRRDTPTVCPTAENFDIHADTSNAHLDFRLRDCFRARDVWSAHVYIREYVPEDCRHR
ncbi:hypothetical protein BURPS1106B_1872 [Burkholderia pseudomallei 1106b]|uniref:Uncharacterized protein n=1 Tax=Burkholderia pseudomallei (strain 1106a) TaxID=357348 RepID=A3P1F0_BURP0|nr:hypothetical protein BURPS1106A_A0117 [Burkholderia pseudomallei 1106a]EES20601.1 hypothetical protein BURPS1106B_1872 [Burkholderia pseudomallei 1106b]